MKKAPLRKISSKRKEEMAREASIRWLLRIKQQNRCAECGGSGDWRGLQLSHEISKARGGRTTEKNCRLLCGKCHAKEHHIYEADDE